MLTNSKLSKLFSGTILGSFAQHMSFVITGSLAFQLTKSEFFTSISWAGNAIAQIFAFPISILITDNFPKNMNMFFSYFFAGLSAIALAILLHLEISNIWIVISYIVILGAAQFIGDTSAMSMVPFIVKNNRTQSAFSILALAYFISSTVGPLITGNMIEMYGNSSSVLFKSILLIFAALIYRSIKLENLENSTKKIEFFKSVKQGYELIIKNQNVLNLFFIHWLVYMLAVPAIHGLIPVYAYEKFNLGAKGVGILFTAIGSGGIMSTILLIFIGDEIKNKTKLIFLCSILAALSMIFFAQSDSKIISLIFLVLFSFAIINILTLRLGLLGELMPKDSLGKIFSINFLSSSTTIIGSSVMGIVAKSFGATIGTTMFGITFLIVLFLMIIFLKSFRITIFSDQATF